jgi:predicted lipoprotein
MATSESRRCRLLAQQLRAAAQAGDWEAMRRLDAAVAAEWTAPGPHRPLSADASEALQELIDAHAEALRRCGREFERVAARLSDVQHGQVASRAYAAEEATR